MYHLLCKTQSVSQGPRDVRCYGAAVNQWRTELQHALATQPLNSWASARRGKWGQLTPWISEWKIKKPEHAKRSSFLCLCYISRAIRAGRCRERRYADHTFIQIYFRMHHFVVKFSKFSSPQAARGHWPPWPKSCGRSCAMRLLNNLLVVFHVSLVRSDVCR